MKISSARVPREFERRTTKERSFAFAWQRRIGVCIVVAGCSIMAAHAFEAVGRGGPGPAVSLTTK